MSWSQHLLLLPILLPLLCGALLIFIRESRHQLKFVINLASTLGLLITALALLVLVDREYWEYGVAVYLSGNWAAPFGITLMVDRLATLLLLLTAVLALASLVYSMQRWSRIGVHFHSLFQFLLMGLNGAFLTHDLFNLFVFFEVMLAASYGLLLHGYNLKRIRAGMQFIAINLVASLLFLIGVALVYAATGTLNMSDLVPRLASLSGEKLMLFKIGISTLAIAFLVKSAMWPLCFWLPTTYAAASPPVAAMLVLMTKVGVYVILRLWLLLFSEASPVQGFGTELLFWGGVATVIFGSSGMLATDEHGRVAGYAAIVSSGTLLAVIGLGQEVLIAPVLFYLLSSTLAVSALMLLVELIERSSNPVNAMLAVTMEAFDYEEKPEQPVGVGIPAALAFVGLAFAGCALVITGLPPLSGFIAKFSLFHGLLAGHESSHGWFGMENLLLLALLLVSGLTAIIALMRNGVRTFWVSGAVPARLQISEVLPVSLLLTLCVVMTLQAGPVLDYIQRTAQSLYQPAYYIERVLTEPVVPGYLDGGH